jgi:hypothetical protein
MTTIVNCANSFTLVLKPVIGSPKSSQIRATKCLSTALLPQNHPLTSVKERNPKKEERNGLGVEHVALAWFSSKPRYNQTMQMKCPLPGARQEFFLCGSFLGLILGALLMSSCISTSPQTATPPERHFHEASTANVIISFPGWNSISITRPQMAQDGFMNFYDRAQIGPLLRRIPAERELAVIVCGFAYSAEQETDQQKIWSSLLADAGFRRVVFVRADSPSQINGAVIVRELQLNGKSA